MTSTVKHPRWIAVLAWLLAVFFVFGALSNLVLPPEMAQSYRRSGYPDWFHLVTAVMELAIAAMLAWRPLRVAGAGLAVAVMGAGILAVVVNHDFGHVPPPLIVLALSALCSDRVHP